MKKILDYLKHIVKDPIKTIDEANQRKKEIMPMLYASIGIFIVSIILSGLLELSFLGFFAFIGFAGIALCLFLFFVIKKAKDKF